jgi:hypothetical protein
MLINHKYKFSAILILSIFLCTLAFAQVDKNIIGSVDISCPSGTSGPILTINDGLPTSLYFEPVSYSTNTPDDPIMSGTNLKLNLFDDRGYDAGIGNCGSPYEITVQINSLSQYFESNSGLNDNVLFVGNGSNNCLSFKGTDWDNLPQNVGLISTVSGDQYTGVSETNIHGQPTNDFSWGGSDFNIITLLSIDEPFVGEIAIDFTNSDINLDIPGTTPIDTYSKSLVISTT